jgi:hypothetical protein
LNYLTPPPPLETRRARAFHDLSVLGVNIPGKRTIYERAMPDRNRPATDAQLRGLSRWGAKIPATLTVGEASDWMDHLSGKSKAGKKIEDADLAGPPNFHRASEERPPQPTAPPLPKPPVPAPEPAGNGHAADLPSPEGWVTVQVEVVRDAKGSIVTVDRTVKLSDHAFPGESHADAILRLQAKAEKAVGL